MTDENDKTEDGQKEAEDSGPVGGERLAEARRAMQIPVIEIAKELHLDEYKVRALEKNEFEVLGAPVFAKGHLRKYAQLVDVDEADVMADYYQLNRSDSSPPVVKFRPVPKAEASPAPWIAGVVAVLLAAAAYWWFMGRDTATPEPEVNSTPAPQTNVAVQDEAPAVDIEAVEDDAADVIAEPAQPEPQPEPEQANGEISLSVSYTGDCWTEISDGRGRRLFFDLGVAGRNVELSGAPPLNILFGDADNVSIEVNGAPYTIPPANRRGRTARLTLAGS